jgi:hypothetical protein
MKKTTNKKTANKTKSYHLLMYVLNCEPKIKKFSSLKHANTFIKLFQAKWPDHLAQNTGSWIDYLVQDVHGKIKFLSETIELS